eukprot:3604482-Prymnesium_polylepis.1
MALSSLNSHRPAVARDLSLARTLDARTAQMPPARAASGSDTAFTNPKFCDVSSRGALSCSSASEASILN